MATQRRNALGRGLDALLSMDDVKTEGSSSINEIELAKIAVNPNQPRREFDETALQELADSIAEIGIIQPITLRKISDDEYQIIAGERRYRASQKAGLKTIPAYIRTADDENMMEMALIENIQREDLNAVEIALAYQHLLDQYELTQERLSERIGKNRTTIANPCLTDIPGVKRGISGNIISFAFIFCSYFCNSYYFCGKDYTKIMKGVCRIKQIRLLFTPDCTFFSHFMQI